MGTPRNRLILSVEADLERLSQVQTPLTSARRVAGERYPSGRPMLLWFVFGAAGMQVQDFEIAVEAAETPEALWSVFAEYFHGTVVQRLVYLHLPPLGAPDSRSPGLRAEGFPEALVARYMRIGSTATTPMLRHAQQHLEPVYWDEITALKPLNERERAFMEEFRRPAWATGSAFTSYGPNGRRGQCGLGFRAGVRRLEPAVLQRIPVGLPARAPAVLRAAGADARAAAGAVAARDRGAGLGGARQEQQPDRRDPRDLDPHGRCAPAADLSEARGLRPDQRGGAGHRGRADPQPRADAENAGPSPWNRCCQRSSGALRARSRAIVEPACPE